jgi:sugar/nucleoside kinase (ribokinase family)
MKRGFICAGCWTTDRVKIVDRWPAEEELAKIMGIDQQGGGSAHNVGIDIRKLDSTMPVATVGMLGEDADGDFLFNLATEYQIDTLQLRRTEKNVTSYTDVITVGSTGKRTFFHHTGANDLLMPSHFDLRNSTAKILHLGLLSVHAGMDAFTSKGDNGWSEVLEQAQAQSILTSIEMVSIDQARNRELVTPCLPFIDYLIVNDHEIGAIADIDTLHDGQTDISLCVDAAYKVLETGKMKSVTVHFPTGAICVTSDRQLYEAPAYSVPQSYIKGSVGAGDAFVAGFLYAMHEDWSVQNALCLAHAVAAVSLGSPTTVGSIESVTRCQEIAPKLHLEFTDSNP